MIAVRKPGLVTPLIEICDTGAVPADIEGLGRPDRPAAAIRGPHLHAPTQVERARPIETGLWKEGPKHATPIVAGPFTVLAAWRELERRANVTSSAETLRAVGKVSDHESQTDLVDGRE